MNNKIIALFALAFPLNLAAQGWVNHGANIQISAGTDIYVQSGEVLNQNDGSIDNNGNIIVEQDWTQTGTNTAYSGSGWVWFSGTADQNILGISTINHLGVDNGNALILGSDLSIGNTLDLNNNGRIQLSTNNLVIHTGASIINYDDTHYIQSNSTGRLQQDVGTSNVVFPIGNSSYNPVTLNNAGTVDFYKIRVGDVVYDNGSSGTPILSEVVNRTWYIDEGLNGGSNINMTLQWDSADELSNFDGTDCGIADWDGSQWNPVGIYGAATNSSGNYYEQYRSAVTNLSAFAVESANSEPMAKVSNGSNGQITQLLSKTALANGSTNRSTSLVEESKPASMVLFPNPANDWINIRFEDLKNQTASIRIYTADGRLTFEQQYSLDEGAVVQISKISDFPVGTYLLQSIMEDGSIFSTPFVKAKN